jgi:hypothetical protein
LGPGLPDHENTVIAEATANATGGADRRRAVAARRDERRSHVRRESANAPTGKAGRNPVENAPPRSSIGDHSDKEDAMKYMLLIHQGSTPTPHDPEAWARLSADEQQAVFADYKAINETPGVTPGLGLDAPETATTVRVEDGRTLTTDGPFVELKEAVGGWLIYEADDLDAAIELAARIPAARHGGAIEVRPVVEY